MKYKIFLVLTFAIGLANTSLSQENITKRKIGYETDGINHYLVFSDSTNHHKKTAVKGTGFLNFSPDSTLFYYLEKKEVMPIKYELVAIDGNNSTKIITELSVNSAIYVNDNGNVIVESGQGDIVRSLFGYDKNGVMIFRDTLKRFVYKSSWTSDSKYFATLYASQEQNEARSTLKVRVFNTELKELYNYVFDDGNYFGSNFFKYEQDTLSVYYYSWKDNVANEPNKYVGIIDVINKKIERAKTTW